MTLLSQISRLSRRLVPMVRRSGLVIFPLCAMLLPRRLGTPIAGITSITRGKFRRTPVKPTAARRASKTARGVAARTPVEAFKSRLGTRCSAPRAARRTTMGLVRVGRGLRPIRGIRRVWGLSPKRRINSAKPTSVRLAAIRVRSSIGVAGLSGASMAACRRLWACTVRGLTSGLQGLGRSLVVLAMVRVRVAVGRSRRTVSQRLTLRRMIQSRRSAKSRLRALVRSTVQAFA